MPVRVKYTPMRGSQMEYEDIQLKWEKQKDLYLLVAITSSTKNPNTKNWKTSTARCQWLLDDEIPKAMITEDFGQIRHEFSEAFGFRYGTNVDGVITRGDDFRSPVFDEKAVKKVDGQ